MTTRWVRWAVLALWAAAGAASAGTLRVTVTPVVTRVQVGGRVQFSATVHDEQNRLAAAGRVAWAVSGGGAVSPAGVFQATTAGTHIVTASVPNTEVAGTATVVVCQEPVGPVAGVLVAPTTAALGAGQSAWFFAMAYDAQGRPVAAPLQWRVSQGGTLSPNGLYTAQAPGTHTLTIEVVGTGLSDSATVTVAGGAVPVPRLVRVVVTPSRASLRVGELRQFGATAYDELGRTKPAPVQWACSAGGTVSPTGVFRARVPGRQTVTARVPGTALTDSATVTVVPTAPPPPPPRPRVVRVTVAPARATLRLGDSQQFSATAYDQRGRAVPAAVRWACSAGGTVSPGGLYRAQAPGAHTVTAEAVGTGVTGAATVTVAGPPADPVTRVTIAPQRASLRVGEAQQFEARAYGRRGRELAVPIEWSCSGGGTVSRTGLYAPTRPGRHTVTAQVPRTPHKATATVTVAPGIVVRVERVEVTPPVVTLRVGERRQLQATAYDARGHAVTVPLQWTCLGGGSMSATGEFRAVRAGTWQVVAQAGPRGPEGKGTVVVWDASGPRVTRVTVTPALAQADVGKTVAFRAMAYDARGRRLNVPMTWAVMGQGEIDELTGEFRATHRGLVTVVAQVVGQPAKGSGKVAVGGPGAGLAVRVEVDPPAAMVAVSHTVDFAARAYDARDHVVPAPIEWRVSGGGSISPAGRFTARTTGTHTVTATVKGTRVSATVRVVVVRRPVGLARLEVKPRDTMLAPGATATFVVEAVGPNGRPAAVKPVWTATGGRITPSGVYTAGPKPGMYEVTARDKGSGLQAKAVVRIAPGGGHPPHGQASIAVGKWDLSDRLLEVRVRVDVTVRGPRLKEVKLFAIERDGDDDHLDTEPCKDGAQVHLSGKYKRGKARHLEIRLYDMAGKVVATERREARQATRDQRPRIDDW